ncbi:MAG: hypothetical protein ABJA11_09270 [Pseudolysinimonas sp.]
MSDDTPTQRFDAPAPRAGGDAAEPEKNTSRRLIIALIGVGAVILIALIVVLIVLLVGNGKPAALATTTPSPSVTISDTPIASSAPSTPPTPTTTPTVAPPPPSGPDLISFTTGTPTVQCDSRTGNPIPLSFRWAGTGGSVVFIAVGATDDPKANGQGWELPTIGTQADFPDELDYSCYSATATYSLGIYDANGHKSVKRITIKNTGEVR